MQAQSIISSEPPIEEADARLSGLPQADEAALTLGPWGPGITPEIADEIAKQIVEGHRKGKQRKRQTDLWREKLVLHIIGSNDLQWLDIYNGSRLAVPGPIQGGLRLQHNLLSPLVANWIAYHTGQKFQVLAEMRADAESRDRAKIDTLYANQALARQKVNDLVAQAMFFAAGYGHCPVHGLWREDQAAAPYEPVYNVKQPGMEQVQVRRGYTDFILGDPFDTCYGEGSRRGSIQVYTYGRTLPITQVKATFGHVPGVETLKGRTDLPSASRVQRLMRKWDGIQHASHGTAVINGEWGGDELVALVCREIAPGILPKYPRGLFEIAAINGEAETEREGVGSGAGKPVLLHRGPLPGGRFSAVQFYGGFAGDDVLGHPYAADLDELQVVLNQLVTHRVEAGKRFARPPLIVGPGGLVDDSVLLDDDAILEMADGSIVPQFLYPPTQTVTQFNEAIEAQMDSMFRIGGWQAASRGESNSGDPAAKVVALMRADDTVFSQVNTALRASLSDLCQLNHALGKAYMVVPDAVTAITGNDFSYLAEPYVTREMLSEDPPHFEVVSGYGATPEATGQQLLQLVGMKGSDGQPLLSTDEFWRRWPDPTLRPPEINAKYMREKHAHWVNFVIQRVGRRLAEQMPQQAQQMIPMAFQMVMQAAPINLDDPPELHLEVLSLITQDDDRDPVSRAVARERQKIYGQLLAQRQMAAAAMQARQGPQGRPGQPGGQPQGGRPAPGQSRSPRIENAVERPRERRDPPAARGLQAGVQGLTRAAGGMT